jgi:hypothetical protein
MINKLGFIELFVNVIRSDKTEKFWESRTLFQKGFRRKAAFLFCEATQEQAFFFVPLVSKKKAGNEFRFAFVEKGDSLRKSEVPPPLRMQGEPPTCAVPLFSPLAKIHPSVALSND